MKICYLAPDVAIPHYRGASTHTYEVSRNLIKRGHEVHLVCRRVDFHQHKREILEGIKIYRIPRGILIPLPVSSYLNLESGVQFNGGFVRKAYEYYLFTLFSLYSAIITSKIIRKHGVEVIMERETSFGAGAIAGRLTNTPLILELIGPRYSEYSFKSAKKILAYTKTIMHDPVSPEKLEIVTAAVNTELFKPDPEGGLRTRSLHGILDAPIIGYVGTFADWHGVDHIVEASKGVLRKFPTARFLMVGPYFEQFKKKSQIKDVDHAFIFTGSVSYTSIPEYINAADILLAPYDPNQSSLRRMYGIGSPLKVFEYMACGKPVVATAIDPITNVVEDGKTGILIPSGKPGALQEAIISLLENPTFAQRMGKNALEKAKHSYSWEVFTSNLEQILLKVLHQGK